MLRFTIVGGLVPEAIQEIVGLLAGLVLIFPASIYFVLRQPYRPEFEVEGRSPSRWRQSLIAMGFEELGQRRQRNAQLGTVFTLFVHPTERDFAMTASVGTVEYLEFTSMSATGAIVDTNNATTVTGTYAHRPNKHVAQYPEVRSASVLYERHKAFRACVMSEDRVVPEDAFEALARVTTEELDHQIRVGILQRSGAQVRPTILGAIRFALYAAPPGNWIRGVVRRQKLDQLIRSRRDPS